MKKLTFILSFIVLVALMMLPISHSEAAKLREAAAGGDITASGETSGEGLITGVSLQLCLHEESSTFAEPTFDQVRDGLVAFFDGGTALVINGQVYPSSSSATGSIFTMSSTDAMGTLVQQASVDTSDPAEVNRATAHLIGIAKEHYQQVLSNPCSSG